MRQLPQTSRPFFSVSISPLPPLPVKSALEGAVVIIGGIKSGVK
jgi:hypothetical protein